MTEVSKKAIYMRRWREKNREHARKLEREYQKRYRANHPEKIWAHFLARKIPLGKKCEECGGTDRLHKHHPDYSKPEEIVTLCTPCHVKHHKDKK